MRITVESDYAFRILLFLSRQTRGMKFEASHIAQMVAIPKRFTLKIMRKLAKKGFITSFRGVGGGYSLAREPNSITLQEVIETIEGAIYLNRCFIDSTVCSLQGSSRCEIHTILKEAQEALLAKLSAYSFEDILRSHNGSC